MRLKTVSREIISKNWPGSKKIKAIFEKSSPVSTKKIMDELFEVEYLVLSLKKFLTKFQCREKSVSRTISIQKFEVKIFSAAHRSAPWNYPILNLLQNDAKNA